MQFKRRKPPVQIENPLKEAMDRLIETDKARVRRNNELCAEFDAQLKKFISNSD